MSLNLPPSPDPAHLLRRREREDAGRLLAWWRDLWRGLGDLRRALLAAIRGLRLPSERLGHPATLAYLGALGERVRFFGGLLSALARQAQAFGLALAGLGLTLGPFAHGIRPGQLADTTPLDALGARYAAEAVAATRTALLRPTATTRTLAAAVEPIKDRALLTTRNEQYRAYRAGTLAAGRAAGRPGWYWSAALDLRTCPVCLALDGTWHPMAEDFASHVGCRCVPEYTEPTGPIGVDWFADQDEETQRAILGPGKLALYRDGRVTLSDLVAETDSARWGPGRAERPLSDFV